MSDFSDKSNEMADQIADFLEGNLEPKEIRFFRNKLVGFLNRNVYSWREEALNGRDLNLIGPIVKSEVGIK